MDFLMNYDEILCKRIQEVKPSGIRRFFDILEEMKDAISLGIGEPAWSPWAAARPSTWPCGACSTPATR